MFSLRLKKLGANSLYLCFPLTSMESLRHYSKKKKNIIIEFIFGICIMEEENNELM